MPKGPDMVEEEGDMAHPEVAVPTDLQQVIFSVEATGSDTSAEGPATSTDLVLEFTEGHFTGTAVITDLTSDSGSMYCHLVISLFSLEPISSIIPVDCSTGSMTMPTK